MAKLLLKAAQEALANQGYLSIETFIKLVSYDKKHPNWRVANDPRYSEAFDAMVAAQAEKGVKVA